MVLCRNCCIGGNAENETFLVNKNNEIANVFIYVIPGQKPTINAEFEKEFLKTQVEIDNSTCLFKPHAAFAYEKQGLVVTNSDPAPHNFMLDPLNILVPPGGKLT